MNGAGLVIGAVSGFHNTLYLNCLLSRHFQRRTGQQGVGEACDLTLIGVTKSVAIVPRSFSPAMDSAETDIHPLKSIIKINIGIIGSYYFIYIGKRVVSYKLFERIGLSE